MNWTPRGLASGTAVRNSYLKLGFASVPEGLSRLHWLMQEELNCGQTHFLGRKFWMAEE